jgi:hypothetical protein
MQTNEIDTQLLTMLNAVNELSGLVSALPSAVKLRSA